MRKVETAETSIVLLGGFNPSIFQPMWFAQQGLIRADEAAEAKVEIVHRDITVFSSGWFSIQVSNDRFVARALQDGHDEELRDLVRGTFDVLSHTPVKCVGLNRLAHFAVDTEEEWHEIGHKLAPKAGLWDDILDHPGTLAVKVQGRRTDDFRGNINVGISPSKKIHPGVLVDINDHYEVADEEDIKGAREAMSIIEMAWGDSIVRRGKIIERVLTL